MLDWLFEWLQRRCPHQSDYVSADITEGAMSNPESMEPRIKWCRRCGAHQYVSQYGEGEWRAPRATWWPVLREDERQKCQR